MSRIELANFNLNLLLALDGLLGARSVTAAAKRLRVTPSAMSHSLAELRSLLEDPLLVRSGRSMVLTPRAQALVVPLHTILLPTYPEEAYWHERFDADPAHAWLRSLVRRTARSFGLAERPRKRSF